MADRKIYMTAFGLLGGWICVPRDLQPDEYGNVCEQIRGCALCRPGVSDEAILSRCWGGSLCGNPDGEDRMHVYVGAGDYSFLCDADEPVNGPLDDERRNARWKELLNENADNFLHRHDLPFTHDAPAKEATR